MKTLQYVGFTGKQCSCQYKVGTVANDLVVVFVQGPLNQTTIANLIEVLASKVLGEDLSGTDPQSVRFFEHYPPHLAPLLGWQEVVFQERQEVAKDKGLMAKLLSFTQGQSPQSTWIVDNPHWKPVSPILEKGLAAFIQ